MTVYLFDAYGTLLDLSAALRIAEPQLGARLPAMLRTWRATQLDYAWLSALGERFENFDIITRRAFHDALATEDIIDDGLVDDLTAAFATLPAFSDAAATLANLRTRGDQTAILSNGTPQWLTASAAHASLTPHLDRILSVEATQTYKPAPAAYAIGVEAFAQPADGMIFVSSNWWDVVGARNFGYRTVWIDRGGGHWPPTVERPTVSVASLTELLTVDVELSTSV